VAIARHGHLVYRESFGFADVATKEKVTPGHLFRIASVSKPITSAAIYKLIEDSKLNPGAKVFGPNGVLAADYGGIRGPHLGQITIHQLLTHTCGGWENDGNDPMFKNPQMNHKELITWTLQHQPVKNPPGQHYAYSNFGYCVLGRVIEHLSGEKYPAFVHQHVLGPCGVKGPKTMRIAGNTQQERVPGEVVYYAQADGKDGNPYDMNVRRMDSHGGWLATADDLVHFAMHVDGFNTTPSILRPETIHEMTTPTKAGPDYASGWSINSAHNWWHNGSLPGANSIMVRTASGLCWAALINTRTKGVDGALDQLIWKMVGEVPAWHA
jgi:CubicO group peptidase (beta-lactamase class C family)